jgi:hypothetical protein
MSPSATLGFTTGARHEAIESPAVRRFRHVQETHCPECYTPLEIRDITPCHDCGWDPQEFSHYRKHTYSEVRVLDTDGLVLCDFCEVDFGSYDPTYFGLPRKHRIGFPQHLRSVTTIGIDKDKYCPKCHKRLAFLKFLGAVRNRRPTEQW